MRDRKAEGGRTSAGRSAGLRPPPSLDRASRAGFATATTRRDRTTRPAARARRRAGPVVAVRGSRFDAAIVSTIPFCRRHRSSARSVAEASARIHGSDRSAARNACPAPTREHPGAHRAGDIHTQDEDQERVDLAVEASDQGRRGPRAPCHPSIDGVERERHRREGRFEQHHVCGLAERVGHQRRDDGGERGARRASPTQPAPARRRGSRRGRGPAPRS